MQTEVVQDQGLKRFFNQVYLFMAIGVAISAGVAFLLNFLWASQVMTILGRHSWLMWVVFGGELALVLGLSHAQMMSKSKMVSYFILYSVLQGLTFTIIPWVYDLGSITAAFLTAVVVFVTMAIYGRLTTKSLARSGQITMMALIGILAATLINIFMHSSTMEYILSYATLIVFIALTAWDNQKLKVMYQQATTTEGGIPVDNLAIWGALELYLDFINIFLSILRIFSRNN